MNSLPDEIKKYLENENANYIVVEGNNRLACLKSGKINGITKDTKIPVLVAVKEENENWEKYEMELKITQGISNVMVVKQWSEIAKAKHLYELCKNKISNGKQSFTNVVREISFELGMTSNDVRKSILRYVFYKEINDISDTLQDNHWGFLEGLDKNKALRAFFGLVEEYLDFEWNLDDDLLTDKYPDTDLKRELLVEMPSIIKSAENDGLNSKQFRDTLKQIIDKNNKNLEDVKDELISFTRLDRVTSWNTIFNNMSESIGVSQEEQWQNKLKSIKKDLETIPVTADWIINLEEDIIKIKNTIEESLEMLEIKKRKLTRQ